MFFSSSAFSFDKKIDIESMNIIQNNGPFKSINIKQSDLKDEVRWVRQVLSKSAIYKINLMPESNVLFFLLIKDRVGSLYRKHPDNSDVYEKVYEYRCEGKNCLRESEYGVFSWMNDIKHKEVFMDETTEYKNGKKYKSVRSYGHGRVVTIFKYPAPNQHEECTYVFHGDNLFASQHYCIPYLNDKKHGKERSYDKENRLTVERLYRNGNFVHQIAKMTWYMEKGGEIQYYFDAISKVEDGLCVTRKVDDKSVLSVKAANDHACLGPTIEELLMSAPIQIAPQQ